MENKFKFSTIFSSIKLRPVVSEEKDKYLSLASANELKKFLPDIDLKANIDLLPIAFDACVVNRVNKNSDVINELTASEIAKNFINKPIDTTQNNKSKSTKPNTNIQVIIEKIKNLPIPNDDKVILMKQFKKNIINPSEGEDKSLENIQNKYLNSSQLIQKQIPYSMFPQQPQNRPLKNGKK